MKKFLSCILLGMTIWAGVLSEASASQSCKTPVRFIYINGSNTNTEDCRSDFYAGIENTHKYMKRAFESSPFVQKMLIKNGVFYIENDPKIFYWGRNSKECLTMVQDDLNLLKVISPKMAQAVRKIIAQFVHDAIWVQKENNMQTIVNCLHQDVMDSYQKGEKVVLFGHSAGSFVTFRYLFHKLPAISSEQIIANLEKNDDGTIDTFYRRHPVRPSCIDAISDSKIAVYSASGEIIKNESTQKLKERYLELDKYTARSCIPDGEVLGVVNYASPIALFYSDSNTSTVEINKYNKDLFRYLKDSNMFLLTVNFADDPFGFPFGRNITEKEAEAKYDVGFKDKGRGFFYSKSDVRSPATFVGAHTSYWKYAKKFSKAVTDAYEEGYRYFYGQ